MLFFSFGNLAFNSKASESMIEMIVSAKNRYDNPQSFFESAVKYIDEDIYPGEGIKEDYDGAYLKEGLYADIVRKWISSMDEKVDIQMDEVVKTYRIKLPYYEPMKDEFILETADEYIMFSWSTSA